MLLQMQVHLVPFLLFSPPDFNTKVFVSAIIFGLKNNTFHTKHNLVHCGLLAKSVERESREKERKKCLCLLREKSGI